MFFCYTPLEYILKLQNALYNYIYNIVSTMYIMYNKYDTVIDIIYGAERIILYFCVVIR